ncbi:MAG: beta-L-arabinofuranosidase domain-containing protein [Acidimicrobiales bacterium]
MSAGPVKPIEQKMLALHPIVDGAVEIVDGFWGARQRVNREVTIPYGMRMLQETGSIENFRIASGSSHSEYRLPLFRDSDLYKVLEAIAWERAHGRDADQEAFFEASVAVIAAAQEDDGYVNSYVQAVEKGRRFENPAMGHELYCAGHMMQASVADTRTRESLGNLAGIANRFASLLVEVLPGEHAEYVPGHPEIETALIELYRTNKDARLVELCSDLIRRRGHGSLSWHMFGPSYFQDDVPFDDATTIRGHAVRALYLLTGATDLYTETGRSKLLSSALAQWQDMVSTKSYLTGGLGSRHKDEAFGDAYELPPDRAYCETCAAIASIMWNWRLLLITGDAVYAELMERTLYNGFLASVGLDGTSFFYVNPLQSREPAARQAWYDCACCPPNAMRFLASLEHYLATRTDEGVQLHQYVASRVRSGQGAAALDLAVTTAYPHDGLVAIRVVAAPRESREIALRVPSWTDGVRCRVNGASVGERPYDKGYLRLSQEWSAGDEVVLELPMRARTLGAAREIDAVRGCVAFERGPLVYCIEGTDLPKGVNLREISVDTSAPVGEQPGFAIGTDSVVALRLAGRVHPTGSGRAWPFGDLNPGGETSTSGATKPVENAFELRATPYYAWANRGATSMRVWVPNDPSSSARSLPPAKEGASPID